MPIPLPTVADRLESLFPNATYELDWANPFQLLVATILAAQCSDERVNKVTPALFARFPTPRDMADSDRSELETLVKSTGFYQMKAASIQEVSRAIADDHGGEVPPDMAKLTRLPRVARKTANVVLTVAHGIASGVVVDSHVHRVSLRMGLSRANKPEMVEGELMRGLPSERWIRFGPAMILHGRRTCTNTKPDCPNCVFQPECPKIGVTAVADTPKPNKTPAAPVVTAVPTPGRVGHDFGTLPADWQAVLNGETEKPYFKNLEAYVAAERVTEEVFPPAGEVFTAFHLTPYAKVRVLLLGQDPYHDNGQAHGLCFSVKPGVGVPPSLRNMFKEMHDDLGLPIPKHGNLSHWAREGVLLLNTVMTVRAHLPASHKDQGWETFTDAVIRAVERPDRAGRSSSSGAATPRRRPS